MAGFDFALANLLAYANEESMADQNLTVVTAIIAGGFPTYPSGNFYDMPFAGVAGKE